MDNNKIINISGLAQAAGLKKHRVVYAFTKDMSNLDTMERIRLIEEIESVCKEYVSFLKPNK